MRGGYDARFSSRDGEQSDGADSFSDQNLRQTGSIQFEKIAGQRRESSPGFSSWTGAQDVVREEVEWLVRSPTRLRIMYRLRESAGDAATVRRSVGVHRTTLSRNLDGLRTRGWIELDVEERSLQLSPAGQVFLDKFDDLWRSSRAMHRLGSFFAVLPESTPVSSEQFCLCRVTNPGAGEPHAPMVQLFELLDESTSIACFMPAISALTVRCLTEQLDVGTTVELVVEAATVDAASTDLRSQVGLVADSERGELLVLTDGPEYGIVLLDDRIGLLAYDRNDRIQALLEYDDSDGVVTPWAEKTYRELQAAARTIDVCNGA